MARIFRLSILTFAIVTLFSWQSVRPIDAQERIEKPKPKTAVLAGGCFWCVESDLEKGPGVVDVIAGYTGGRTPNPTYKTYASKGYREAVLVTYDPTKITFAGLVEYFIKHIDPVDKGGSFVDRGKGYSPAIYVEDDSEKEGAKRVIDAIDKMKVYKNPLTIPVLDRVTFYPAEAYHQDYHNLNSAAYGAYRQKCGRDDFVRKIWGKEANVLSLPGAYPENSDPRDVLRSTKDNSSTTENSKEGDRWKDYKKPEAETLRQKLSRVSYRVTQASETEPAFRNGLWDHHEAGIYVDVVSGEPLFLSTDKFDSGTGWPSFVKPYDPRYVIFKEDRTEGMARIEVRSKYADSHLGHVFNDGPVARGGMRFCINSASLRFIPVSKLEEEGFGEIAKLFKKGE
jgi:peptide methionine sulfoxide reductase msrA/msrB